MKKIFLLVLMAFFSLSLANSKVIEINEEKWENIDFERPVVIDVYAKWCQPCKMYSPVIERLSKEFAGKVDFYKIDADKNTDFLEFYNISAFPTTLFFCSDYSDGNWGEVGVLSYDELKLMIGYTIEKFEYENSLPVEFSYQTGLDYLEGEHGAQFDLRKAAEYFHRAAMKGHVESMKQLSAIYQQIEMLNPWKSFYWCMEAAKAGDAVAQRVVGLLLNDGYGCDYSPTEAVMWWRKAAEQNEPYAEYCLGLAYTIGAEMGVPQDFDTARYWFERAAAHGNEEALEYIK